MKQIACIAFGCLLLSSETANSFDCDRAKSKTEMMICNYGELWELDDKLSKIYKQTLKRPIDKQKLLQEQRYWLNEIRDACQDTLCLNFVYRDRISDLIEYGKHDESGSLEKKEIVKMECDSDHQHFSLKYDESNDIVLSPPISFQKCQIGLSAYKVLAFRLPNIEGRPCMAEPPIVIWVYRNEDPLVVETTFGKNCFGGDALDSYEAREVKEKVDLVKFCVAARKGPSCKTFTETSKTIPLDQNRLSEYRLREN